MHANMTEAQKEVIKIGEQIEGLRKKMVEIQKSTPDEEIKNYEFTGPNGTTTLNDLFGTKNELIMVHNMGQGCSYCTLWADGFNGFTEHFNDRAQMVLSTPDDFKSFSSFAEKRGWKFQYFSTDGMDFPKDMGFFGDYGNGKEGPHPGLSFFYKKDGKIFRNASDNLGPGDQYCSIWHMFDMLKEGKNDWNPKQSYSN